MKVNDLYQELMQKRKELTVCIKLLRKNGTAFAAAERDYKIILRQECLKLRAEGMAVGMIDKCAYGVPAVADARFKRDVAEAVYLANRESINAIKLEMRIIAEQHSREWNDVSGL